MVDVAAPPPILALVADPQRWQLLAELARSDRRVGELTEALGKPQNLVSYHLGELRSAGIVTSRRSSADRRDVYYSADLVRCRELFAEAAGAVHPALATPPPSDLRPSRVLFLCTGNSARSQIAEALLRERSGGRIVAHSAGSDPKPLHPKAVQVLAERGIDIAGSPTKHLRRFARTKLDRVVTLCDKVREVCPEFPGTPPRAHWSIPDPAADGDVDAFRRVADEIEIRVGLLLAELAATPKERTRHAR